MMPRSWSSGPIFITLALVFYTIGVWSERIVWRLKGGTRSSFGPAWPATPLGTAIIVDYGCGLTADVHGVTGVAGHPADDHPCDLGYGRAGSKDEAVDRHFQ